MKWLSVTLGSGKACLQRSFAERKVKVGGRANFRTTDFPSFKGPVSKLPHCSMARIVAKLDTTLLWLGNFGQRRNIPNGILAKAFHAEEADLDFTSRIGKKPNTRLRGTKCVENMCKTEEVGPRTTKGKTFLLQKIRWETDFLDAVFVVGITRTSGPTTRYRVFESRSQFRCQTN